MNGIRRQFGLTAQTKQTKGTGTGPSGRLFPPCLVSLFGRERFSFPYASTYVYVCFSYFAELPLGKIILISQIQHNNYYEVQVILFSGFVVLVRQTHYLRVLASRFRSTADGRVELSLQNYRLNSLFRIFFLNMSKE